MAVGLHQHRRGVATLNQRVTKSRRPMMGINTKSQWPWCRGFDWEINGQLVHVGVYDVPCVAISCWHLSFHGLVKCGGKTLEDETLPKLSSACERIKDWGIWTHLRKATQGLGKIKRKHGKGRNVVVFGQVQVKERKVIGRRLWNNARHGHSLNLLRTSASLFSSKKEKFCSVKGSTMKKPKKSHHHRFIHVCVCRASPPISGWFSTTTKEMSLHDDTHGAVLSQVFLQILFAFWALKVVDYRQSTMTRFGGKTENPSMHNKQRQTEQSSCNCQRQLALLKRVLLSFFTARCGSVRKSLNRCHGYSLGVSRDTHNRAFKKNYSCAPPSRLIMICLLEFSPDFWPNRQRSFKRLAARWHSPAALDLEGEIDALYNDPCQLALRKDYPFGYARKI